ncbi:MAG: TetR/AcrR family transcriptional regulator [Thermodesulfobacteriota bacterium]
MRDRRLKERAEAKRQTRQALLEAGLEAIIEHGLDASLDAICARAGYTRGAFYVHFKSREELLVGLTEWVLGGMVDTMLGTQATPEGLTSTIERFMRGLEAGTWPLVPHIRIAAIRLMDGINRWPALRRSFDALITQAIERLTQLATEGQRQGLIRADLDPGRLGQLLTIFAMGTIMLHNVGAPIDFDPQRSVVLQMLVEPSRGTRGQPPRVASE